MPLSEDRAKSSASPLESKQPHTFSEENGKMGCACPEVMITQLLRGGIVSLMKNAVYFTQAKGYPREIIFM